MAFQLTAERTGARRRRPGVLQPADLAGGGAAADRPRRAQSGPARGPPEIETIAVTVALDDGLPGSLADIAGLGGERRAGRVPAPAQGLTTERAAVLAEIYRRSGAWKLRSVSAGWTEGWRHSSASTGCRSRRSNPAAPAGRPRRRRRLSPPTRRGRPSRPRPAVRARRGAAVPGQATGPGPAQTGGAQDPAHQGRGRAGPGGAGDRQDRIDVPGVQVGAGAPGGRTDGARGDPARHRRVSRDLPVRQDVRPTARSAGRPTWRPGRPSSCT